MAFLSDFFEKGGGATGAYRNEIFYENEQVVDGDYTVVAEKNAVSAGPIVIQDGVTVTIADGARWAIV